MKVLYVGQYSEGTTSKMRADHLNAILQPKEFKVIDSHVPFFETGRLWRSLGFRYKKGPLITKINNYIITELERSSGIKFFDIIWVDKAVFLSKATIEVLRSRGGRLVHFTPDMAFFENRSAHFENSLDLYDFLVTTKSAEVDTYRKFISEEKLILTSQGFSRNKHFPVTSFEKKEKSIAFIGLAEKSRFKIMEYLLSQGVHLKVAGMGWEKFARKHKDNPHFHYAGKGVYGSDYSRFISSSMFGLGLLSKRFPELHTTRTFEIPACGTVLITERNQETTSFYKDDEVVFYSSPKEMLDKINYLLGNKKELEQLTHKGLVRVNNDGYDYESILKKILNQVLV